MNVQQAMDVVTISPNALIIQEIEHVDPAHPDSEAKTVIS
jgi:hypothetical protein